MLVLGIDVGTSAIKVSVVDIVKGISIITVQFPDSERDIKSLQPGWAEQSPLQWWNDVKQAILKANASNSYNPKDIKAIGIAYQMHGLVCIDKEKKVLRDSIIWCDSRAVQIGNDAFKKIGEEKCLSHLLNSPGNFTASKLAWVKQNEPDLYYKIDKIMLPGDFLAMQFTGEISTTAAALSEGIFWDFKNNELSKDVMSYFGFDQTLIPEIKDVFTEHGKLLTEVAKELSLTESIPVTYKAGDQPNNAFSLNVLQPGEVAATAGTSGVIYAVSDQPAYDKQSRVNSFAHVNYTAAEKRTGVLLNINGTGILNRWLKNVAGTGMSYQQMNEAAAKVKPGSDGLFILSFGNGAERMLNNKILNAHFNNIDFNRHNNAHLFRAAQEGIAFALRYGFDIMRENGIQPSVIRAGKANMFLSPVFTEAFVNVTNTPVEFYNTDGSTGAALGAGIGAGIYSSAKEAFSNFRSAEKVEPKEPGLYNDLYQQWKTILLKQLN
ncbi:MAG: carbohydrate kinase [Bacteroidia bacterium]|nr:carbohydrate kinase [Bacteroidia bacterium]